MRSSCKGLTSFHHNIQQTLIAVHSIVSHKNEWTREKRAKNAGSDVQRTYDIFYTTCNNLKRKLKKDEAKLNEFDAYFKDMRKMALALKNSVTDDSPDTELRKYREKIREMTDEIVNFADKLNDEIKDMKYRSVN